ncbi:MAG: efflux RND transporter permease subunit [Planctomycetes bacterium]|nr:efflux RND transporter permease subunit [Planctomycetota bacterium]
MINALIRWSLANRLAVVILSVMLMVVGAFVATTVPVDVFPDLTAPTVSILVEGHGMAPEEMEMLVTFPIETAVNGAANVRRVRSATAVGIAVVWVEFEWGTDIYRARQTVNERLTTVSGRLPSQVEPPTLAPMSSIMGEILFISLTSNRHSPLELRTVATTNLLRRLQSVPGVAKVTPIGGDEKQYQVVLSPARLRGYDISVLQVIEALRGANENVSAGFIVQGGQESILQGVGRIQTERDIADTVIAMRGDRPGGLPSPVTVSDLGIVRIGAAIKRGAAAASWRGPNWEPITEPAVILAIQKQPGTNTLTLTQQFDVVLDEMQASLPDGMLINKNLFRQADFILVSIHNTIEALRDGGIMVILVVIAFLASMRSSIITLLAIPISLIVTVLALKVFGASINTMTLGGMAIAIGALVDDAIIDVENIVRRLRENAALPNEKKRPPIEIVFKASVEVRASIVFATLIILLVFLPLFFLSGVEGRLLQPLGIAFMVSLAASLFVALTVTPALSYYLLPTSKAVTRPTEPWIVRFLKRIYDKPLRWAMGHPWLVALPTALLLGLAVVGGASLGRSFLPEFNEGALVVGVVTLPGTSLVESDRLTNIIQTTLMQHPEIVSIGRRTGRAQEDEHVQGVEASEIDLTLDMDAPVRLGLERRSKAELLESLRNSLAAIPGVQTTFGQPIGHRVDHMLSGTRANIAVKIFGSDLKKLRSVAKQIENTIRSIPGVVDLSTEQQTDISMLRVEFDRVALARFGLTSGDASTALEAAFQGVEATQILERRRAYDLVVRVGETTVADSWMKASSREVREVLVDVPADAGTKIPLKALARISEERGPNLIMRENAQRRIIVQCNVAGRDLGGVVDDIRIAVADQVELPQGYYVEYGGQFESAEQTRRRLAILGLAVVLGIGFLLHVVFRSVRDAALIMLNLPLAMIGGVVGVYLSGGVLSVASLIGFIGVFGIAARNGIMMVSHIRHLQRFEGVSDFAEAVRLGAMERLAPILMTAMGSGLALIPLVVGGDQPGKEILSPMAMVILFGLLSSTFLNMIVVPALFLRLALPVEAEPPVEIDGDIERIGHALPAAPV